MLVHTTCRVWRNCFNDERWLGTSPDGSSLIFLLQSYSFPPVNFHTVANESSLRNSSLPPGPLAIKRAWKLSLTLKKSSGVIRTGLTLVLQLQHFLLWETQCLARRGELEKSTTRHVSFGHPAQNSRQRIPGDSREFSVQPWLTNDYMCNRCKARQ